MVLDDPESLEEAVLWLHKATTLTLVSQHGDTMIGDEVKAVLPQGYNSSSVEIIFRGKATKSAN